MRWLILFPLLGLSAFADPAPDCRYSGAGTVFVFDKAANKFVPNYPNSYLTSGVRIPLGNGNYLVQQTKTFNDGRPPQRATYRRDRYVGPVDLSAADGSLIVRGYCSRIGHCFGETKGPAAPNELHWTVDYDANGIRVVTAAASGAFYVDEILTADEPCEFRP